MSELESDDAPNPFEKDTANNPTKKRFLMFLPFHKHLNSPTIKSSYSLIQVNFSVILNLKISEGENGSSSL